jgi:hypothetical protein
MGAAVVLAVGRIAHIAARVRAAGEEKPRHPHVGIVVRENIALAAMLQPADEVQVQLARRVAHQPLSREVADTRLDDIQGGHVMPAVATDGSCPMAPPPVWL